mgnify:CR=1 FL=1
MERLAAPPLDPLLVAAPALWSLVAGSPTRRSAPCTSAFAMKSVAPSLLSLGLATRTCGPIRRHLWGETWMSCVMM